MSALRTLQNLIQAGRNLADALKIVAEIYENENNLGGDRPFTESFVSAEQTITAAGTLTLPHSLSTAPELIQLRLICKTAEFGYSIGDELMINFTDITATTSTGVSLVPDSTNINIRYGSAASSVNILRKDTGNATGITNASWKLIVKAWT